MLRKLVLGTAVTLVAAATVFAQGTVNFANNSTTLVTYGANSSGLTGPLPVATALGNTFVAQLYYAPDSPTAPTTLQPLGATTSFSGSLPGRFSGSFRTTPSTTAPGGRAWFQVLVWETAFGSSYEAAAANRSALDVAGVNRVGFVGTSSVFNIQTGAPPGPATQITTAGGLTAFAVNPVPEPTTYALGLIGLVGMFLLRRRNK